MTLYLVRHGEACPESEDPQRPLTPRGIAETQKIAAFLKGMDIKADRIIHSAKLRARQTAEILRDGLGCDISLIESDGLAPNDSAAAFCDEINTAGRDMMIVGHLPFLDKLVSLLIVGDETHRIIKFQESSAAILEQDVPPLWRISGYITPQMASR